MKKNQRHPLWNRVGDLVGHGRDRFGELSDGVEHQARIAARRAWSGFNHGRDAICSAEESVSQVVRTHPLAFVLAGAGLACLAVAALLWRHRDRLSPRR